MGLVVYNGSESVDLDSYTCTIEATRTDGTAITAAVTTNDNIGAFVTTATMTNKADKYLAKLVLFDSNSRRVASIAFVMCVTPKTMDENAESIEEDASLYQQYTEAVQTLIADIREDISDLENEKIQKFATCVDIKASTALKSGMVCQTAGYYAVNDGGAALYRICNAAPETYYETLSNGLYAELIIKNVMTPEMVGAYGDDTHDDTVAIQTALDSGHPVYMAKKYLITSSVVISVDKRTLRCDGEIRYTGTDSAIIINGGWVNLYVKELITNGNGVEMHPLWNQFINCQFDIIECGRIICIGNNGIGLYLNSVDGVTQFCKFIINRLQGGYSQIGTNTGIKIIGTSKANRYCNACVFDIHSICFWDTGILTDTVAYSCISNYFKNINFEQNNVSINMINARFRMEACYDENTAGKIVVTNGTVCEISLCGILADNNIDLTALERGDITNTSINIFGRIFNNNGIYIADNLRITQLGAFSVGATTPFVSTNLANVIGSNHVKYVKNGDVLELPSIRKGNSGAGYVLPSYNIWFSSTNGSTGTLTLNFSDGSTKTINYTSTFGRITVLPNAGNNGQWVFYEPLTTAA